MHPIIAKALAVVFIVYIIWMSVEVIKPEEFKLYYKKEIIKRD